MQADASLRFENFIVGSANRLAVAAARAVAQSPGATYNPLFIYSDSGLGKTHLLAAISHLARELQPDLNIYYATVDLFMDELHAAITAGDVEAAAQRYASVDVLLLDDVQFLAGRQETQSEMLRLFNTLQGGGRQIVLTSDRPPAEIADLDQRLITRLSGGLIVDIGVPDYETRVAILRRKCGERGVEFQSGVVEEVARIGYGNVRELQGALNRLIAFESFGEGEVSTEGVREVLGESPASAPGLARGAGGSGEYESFLSGIAVTVAQHIDPRRVRLLDSVTHWKGLGYLTSWLERAIGAPEPANPEEVLAQYEGAIVRLRTLEQEVTSLDVTHRGADIFRDPERLEDAERLAERLRVGATPQTTPIVGFSRNEFEEGPSNQLAVRAADAIVEEPGRRYNPLFVHGKTGVGKTHLLHAIGNELVAASGGAMTVACVAANEFVNELIAALQEGTIERWRARYRAVDALVLDDIQCVAGTERTQEELFHVFNALTSAAKQVVLSSDRAPKALEDLDERLRSRFEGGLVVELQPPDRMLREKVYARILTGAGVTPGRELLAFLASTDVSSVSEVIARAGRLLEASQGRNGEMTAAFARRALDGDGHAEEHASPAPGVGAGDAFFLDGEKTIWDWPEIGGRVIEDLR